MDGEDFERKFRHLQQQTAKLSQAVQDGDRTAIEARFSGVGKACHKKYKE